ncbi:MAG: sulfatase-like hydrolase/transferase, partial [Planctomycetota bacterium]
MLRSYSSQLKRAQFLGGLALAILTLQTKTAEAKEPQARAKSNPPNIVWIIPDDMSANFSCYGETAVKTPNVDRLAAEGVKFTNAVVTAPVCSTCRSA